MASLPLKNEIVADCNHHPHLCRDDCFWFLHWSGGGFTQHIVCHFLAMAVDLELCPGLPWVICLPTEICQQEPERSSIIIEQTPGHSYRVVCLLSQHRCHSSFSGTGIATRRKLEGASKVECSCHTTALSF